MNQSMPTTVILLNAEKEDGLLFEGMTSCINLSVCPLSTADCCLMSVMT